MTRKDLIILLLSICSLIAFCFFFVDTRVLFETQHIRKDFYIPLKILSILISPPTFLCIWTVIFCWVLFIQKSKKAAKFYFPLVFGLIMTNGFIRILKVIIGRSRPDYFLTEGLYQFQVLSFDRHFSSIPSGHAATIGAFMGFLVCIFPNKASWIIIFGVSLSFVRVLIGAHYVSDVLIGDFIGFYITWMCYYKYKNEAYLSYAEKG